MLTQIDRKGASGKLKGKLALKENHAGGRSDMNGWRRWRGYVPISTPHRERMLDAGADSSKGALRIFGISRQSHHSTGRAQPQEGFWPGFVSGSGCRRLGESTWRSVRQGVRSACRRRSRDLRLK